MFEELTSKIGDFAKDIKLNIQTLMTAGNTPGLTETQRNGIALACSYATFQDGLVEALEDSFPLNEEYKTAAKSAAAVMAMNNIYYRFLHLSEDKEFSKMPAKLRMNVIGRPGIERVDFELMSLAISAISGCGMCINSHIAEVKKAGITNEGIQSTIRLAAVINAVKTALKI